MTHALCVGNNFNQILMKYYLCKQKKKGRKWTYITKKINRKKENEKGEKEDNGNNKEIRIQGITLKSMNIIGWFERVLKFYLLFGFCGICE